MLVMYMLLQYCLVVSPACILVIMLQGGIVASSGFISLGLVWLVTTYLAFSSIKKGQIVQHQKWMIYSYAACFAAVTLRIWLPLLTLAFGEFLTAYKIVAWLCWVPNILVAFLLVRRLPNH